MTSLSIINYYIITKMNIRLLHFAQRQMRVGFYCCCLDCVSFIFFFLFLVQPQLITPLSVGLCNLVHLSCYSFRTDTRLISRLIFTFHNLIVPAAFHMILSHLVIFPLFVTILSGVLFYPCPDSFHTIVA